MADLKARDHSTYVKTRKTTLKTVDESLKVVNRARSRSESARQRNQTNFGYIKEYTLEGVFVRDIGNNYATEHKVNT